MSPGWLTVSILGDTDAERRRPNFATVLKESPVRKIFRVARDMILLFMLGNI